jgi:hypothetical protein
MMSIPDDLLTDPDKFRKDQTFLRLLNCLQPRLKESDYREVSRAVGILQSVNKVRVALQHSGASPELHSNFTKLGALYPPQWEDAWDRVRAATIEALRIIREKVLIYAAESA